MLQAQGIQVPFLGREDPPKKEMAAHSRILGRRNLTDPSPWGHKDSDMAEQHIAYVNTYIILYTVSFYSL